MTVDAERFRAISIEDLTMPGGWSVSAGQTFLYTPAELRLMQEARQFAQREILPHSAAAHRRVKEIKAGHEPGPERRRLLRQMARAYLKRSSSTTSTFRGTICWGPSTAAITC